MENRNSAPAEACVFTIEQYPVDFAQTAAKNNFRIVALSGKPILKHPYWGNLGFDHSGIKFATNPTPILEEHNRDVHIGFSTKQVIADQVILEGSFLSNPRAQQVKKDISEGFPMQASVYLPPSEVQQLGQGESAIVNGQTLNGPGAIFRKGKILEVSMCSLGADGKTSSKVFSDGEQDIKFSVVEENASDNQDEIDKNKKPATTEDVWKKEFAASKDLQDEFRSEKYYIAYKKAEANGQVNLRK
jgi:hypothetical protein